MQHVYNWSPSESLRAVARECGIDCDAAEIDYAELERRRKIAEAQAAKARAVREAEQRKATQAAIWRTSHYLTHATAVHYHPYIDSKMLTQAHNTLQYINAAKGANRLVIPIHDLSGGLMGCQLIYGTTEGDWQRGDKQIVFGSRKKGNLHWLQSPPRSAQPIAIVEGWATGASLIEPEIGFSGAVAVAFDAGNMPLVCNALLIAYPACEIFIYNDFDAAGDNAADKCASIDPRRVTIIKKPAGLPSWATDWNDVLVIERDKKEAIIERDSIASF